MKKPILATAFLLVCTTIFAQTPSLGIDTATQSIWDEVRKSAPMILATVFLISVLINSGKLFGENRDYVAFFRGVVIWIAGIALVGGIVTYILSLSF